MDVKQISKPLLENGQDTSVAAGPAINAASRKGGSKTWSWKWPNAQKAKYGQKPNYTKRAITALVVLGAAFGVYKWLAPAKAENVITAKAKRGAFDVTVVESGELQAKRSVNISAPVLASGGRSQLAIQYLAPEGTTVDSGTLVVAFDPQDQFKIMGDKQNELKLALADLEKLKAQQSADESQASMDFENAKLQYELAKLSNEAMKFESDAKQREAKLEMRKAELQFQQAERNVKNKSTIRKSELGNLQLRVSQLQSVLERAQGDVEKLQLKAPGAGLIVYQRSWNTGRKIAKGDQVWGGQPIAALPDLSQMQAVVQVNEVDISKVKKDQKVEIALDAFPDRKFEGKISNVASIGNPKEGNPTVKVFEVIVDIDGVDPILKPGMTVSARITVSQLENVISVPIESVFDDNGKTVCYVDNGSATFTKREVKLGAKNDNFVVVTNGLNGTEKVSLIDPTQDASTAKKDKDKKSGNSSQSSASPAKSAPAVKSGK